MLVLSVLSMWVGSGADVDVGGQVRDGLEVMGAAQDDGDDDMT